VTLAPARTSILPNRITTPSLRSFLRWAAEFEQRYLGN